MSKFDRRRQGGDAGDRAVRSPHGLNVRAGPVFMAFALALFAFAVGCSSAATPTVEPPTVVQPTVELTTAPDLLPALVQIDTDVRPAGAGEVDISPKVTISSPYRVGATIVLTANPNPGFTFVNWVADVDGTENPMSITLSADISVVAVFQAVADQ